MTTPPKTRAAFWSSEFEANMQRDKRELEELTAAGWSCLVVWQCELRDLDRAGARVADFIDGKGGERDVGQNRASRPHRHAKDRHA